MLALAADENFNNDILRGVRRRNSTVATMTRYAYDRVRDNKPMPGVFEVGRHVPISVAIEHIELLAECSIEGEWEGQVRYLPFR